MSDDISKKIIEQFLGQNSGDRKLMDAVAVSMRVNSSADGVDKLSKHLYNFDSKAVNAPSELAKLPGESDQAFKARADEAKDLFKSSGDVVRSLMGRLKFDD